MAGGTDGGGDAFSQAAATLTFHDFLEKMRHPSAADLVRSIKSFIVSFQSGEPNPEQDSASVQTFLTQTEATFRAHKLWAGASEEELESAGEGLEKYLMTKLFTRAFAALPEDVEKDRVLTQRMTALQQFLRPEHLDIPANFRSESSWLLAQKELQKMNQYKAPRDKLVCILNCCRVINNLLLNMSMAADGTPPGADDFLPVLIYVVIKANPPQLHSNLQYIQRYRLHGRLVSEAAYFYTNLVSAASFIETLAAGSLSIDPAEFDRKMAEASQATPPILKGTASDEGVGPAIPQPAGSPRVLNLAQRRAVTPPPAKPPRPDAETEPSQWGRHHRSLSDGDPSPQGTPRLEEAANAPPQTSTKAEPKQRTSAGHNPRLSISELETAGAEAVVVGAARGELARSYRWLYASVGDLRVSDVEALLTDYKELVLKYEALARAVEGRDAKSESQPAVTVLPASLLRVESESAMSIGVGRVDSEMGLRDFTPPKRDTTQVAGEQHKSALGQEREPSGEAEEAGAAEMADVTGPGGDTGDVQMTSGSNDVQGRSADALGDKPGDDSALESLDVLSPPKETSKEEPCEVESKETLTEQSER